MRLGSVLLVLAYFFLLEFKFDEKLLGAMAAAAARGRPGLLRGRLEKPNLLGALFA